MDIQINAIFLTLTLCILYAYAAGAIIISEELKNFLFPGQRKRGLFSTPTKLLPSWLLSVSFPMCITGAYLLPGSTNYVRDYGIVGLILQILYSYLSIPIVVLLYQRLQRQLPRCPDSLVQYVYWRHGMVSGLVFNLLSIFNTLSLLVGEYVVIQEVLQLIVKEDWFVVTLLALVAVLSAAYGGTLCSIVCDAMQGVVFFISTLAFCALIAGEWRHDLPASVRTQQFLGLESWQLPYSIFSNFCLYVPLYVISEPLWLRAASAKNVQQMNSSMWGGLFIGLLIATVYGALAVMSVWAGQITDEIPMAVGIFHMFPESGKQWESWPNMLMLIVALSLNRSYADAHHDGLMRLLQPLVPAPVQYWLMPLLLVGVNAPMLALAISMHSGTTDVNVLYVPAGILVTSVSLPLLLGILDSNRRFIGGSDLMVTVFTAAIGASVYGCVHKGSLSEGFSYAWADNLSSWDVMTVSLVASVVGLGANMMMRRLSTHWQDLYSGCLDGDLCAQPFSVLPRIWVAFISFWHDHIPPSKPIQHMQCLTVQSPIQSTALQQSNINFSSDGASCSYSPPINKQFPSDYRAFPPD